MINKYWKKNTRIYTISLFKFRLSYEYNCPRSLNSLSSIPICISWPLTLWFASNKEKQQDSRTRINRFSVKSYKVPKHINDCIEWSQQSIEQIIAINTGWWPLPWLTTLQLGCLQMSPIIILGPINLSLFWHSFKRPHRPHPSFSPSPFSRLTDHE